MAIAPQTKVYILKGVPLDNTYRNTITFTSAEVQSNYFMALKKYSSEAYSYKRLEKETIRVNIYADYLYDCNYLMYQNNALGDGKWVYCFITGIQYINDEVTELTIEIDVIQTWRFNYTVHPSFVEREHVYNDAIGAHLVPENLELGDYVRENEISGEINNYSITVAATFDSNLQAASGELAGFIYTGLHFTNFAISQIDLLNEFIDNAVANQKADGIVAIFMSPNFADNFPAHITTEIDKNYGDFDGYVPKNNKLFTHPYNFLYVFTDEGAENSFPYEYFSTEKCTFIYYNSSTCNVDVTIAPQNYKGIKDVLGVHMPNLNEKMTLGGFPQCAFNIDSYKAWLAQNAGATIIQGAGRGAELAESLGTLNPAATVNSVLGIAQDLNKITVASRMPNAAKGSSVGGSMFANGAKNFYFSRMRIRGEFALIIDDYFSTYGYKVNSIKVPNETGRSQWNYVKTVSSNITGSIPANDLAKIRSIYDNGVTFWHNGANVGNYELDNSIIGGA